MAAHAAGGITATEADIAAAADHGIDFFALDWWPSRPEQNRRIDDRFLAAANADRIRFCVFYETQAVDPRLPMVLVTSWNEWNEDTSIEPIEPAPPTGADDSPSGHDLTGGATYAGYGSTYLDVIAARFAD